VRTSTPSSTVVVNLGFAGEVVALAVLSMPMLAICNGTVEPNFSYTHVDLFKNAPDLRSAHHIACQISRNVTVSMIVGFPNSQIDGSQIHDETLNFD
jgi:hypothetical protein